MQIKEHPSWEASINIKKLLICVHSSTFGFSDSATLIYIRVHSCTFVQCFVYTRLVTRLCF